VNLLIGPQLGMLTRMPTNPKGEQEAQNHVVFLEIFFDELRRKVPVGK
jgi:hypothetical protein